MAFHAFIMQRPLRRHFPNARSATLSTIIIIIMVWKTNENIKIFWCTQAITKVVFKLSHSAKALSYSVVEFFSKQLVDETVIYGITNVAVAISYLYVKLPNEFLNFTEEIFSYALCESVESMEEK